MSFLFPLGWIFAALVPVIIALYLRRVRRKHVVVPTLLFWQRALGEQSRRAFLGRLRQLLSLLLQLLIFTLILLALVRPEPAGFSRHGHSTVIILDSRARMQAMEPDGKTRFAKAVALAKQTAANAREGASVAVLSAHAQPEVVAPFSTDPAQLLRHLDALQPTDDSGDLKEAVALARELLAARPGNHRLLVFTDGRELPDFQTADAQDASVIPVEIVPVGTPRNNVAITRFAARPQLASPQTSDLLLSLANYGNETAEGTVEITADGALLDVKPFRLAPGEQRTEVFPAIDGGKKSMFPEAPARLQARLELKSDDALPLDNVAYATRPAVKPLHVLLVSKGNWFLEKVLPANPAVRFEMLEPGAFSPAMAGSFDVVIFDGEGPDLATLTTGNALYIKQSPLGTSGTLKEPLVTDSDPANPLLRFVEWQNVTLLRASELPPPSLEGWRFEVPLRSFEHPLIITGEQGSRRIAIFAFDIAESDLPLRVAFPLLISNTLQWLASGGQPAPLSDLEAGQGIPLPAGATVRPAESDTAVATRFFQPHRNGFYQIRTGETEQPVAVNTFSPQEADLRTGLAEQGTSLLGNTNRLWAGAASRPLWQWLALTALLLIGVEWGLYHRRHTE